MSKNLILFNFFKILEEAETPVDFCIRESSKLIRCNNAGSLYSNRKPMLN